MFIHTCVFFYLRLRANSNIFASRCETDDTYSAYRCHVGGLQSVHKMNDRSVLNNVYTSLYRRSQRGGVLRASVHSSTATSSYTL